MVAFLVSSGLWPLSLMLTVLVTSQTEALVAVPERRPVTVSTRRRDGPTTVAPRLFLQTSPLIGGPTWLPLHVKVVLEDDGMIQRWDFVPLNATDASTLQRLVTLQSVPAQVRHQSSTRQLKNDRTVQTHDILDGFDIVLEEPDSGAGSRTEGDVATAAMVAKRRKATELLIQRAHSFRASYREEMHLIRNNCWTFALQLYDCLLEESACDELSLLLDD